jgi:hypothetical protein
MGLEYHIETADPAGDWLPEFLPKLPGFADLVNGTYQFGHSAGQPIASIRIEPDHIYLCEHAASSECDAIFARLIRQIAGRNERVVIVEL